MLLVASFLETRVPGLTAEFDSDPCFMVVKLLSYVSKFERRLELISTFEF